MGDDTPTHIPEPLGTDDTVPEPPSLPELNHRFAQLVAFESAVKEYVTRARADMTGQYLAAYRALGAKTFDAKGTDGTLLAQFTLKENSATHDTIAVDNAEEFKSWVLDTHPTEVEMVTVVRPAFQDALLGRVQYDAEDEVFVDTETGELVQGLKFTPGKPAAEPTSFQTSWKKQGKETVLAELRDVAIGEVLALPKAG